MNIETPFRELNEQADSLSTIPVVGRVKEENQEISLLEALKPEIIAAYNRRATGEKYLINPAKGVAA